jgi:hypothetical protein
MEEENAPLQQPPTLEDTTNYSSDSKRLKIDHDDKELQRLKRCPVWVVRGTSAEGTDLVFLPPATDEQKALEKGSACTRLPHASPRTHALPCVSSTEVVNHRYALSVLVWCSMLGDSARFAGRPLPGGAQGVCFQARPLFRVFVESVLKHIDSLPDEFVDPCWVCTIAKTTRVGEDLVNLLDIVRKGNFVSTVIGDWRLEEFYEGLVDLEYFVYGEAVCASHIGTEERPDRFAVRQAWGDRLKAYRAQFEVFHALACEKHRDADRPDYDQLCAFW